MLLYRDEAVVLRTAKLGEADRIITLLTRGHGKIRAVAKGVRRTKSRFGARLEPFMRVDVLIAEGRSLDVVSQAESVAAYGASIATDYAAYEAANVIVETADKLVNTEHEQTAHQYRLVIGALNALAKHAHAPRAIGDSYVMRALALAGWTPRLATCVVCGQREGAYLSIAAGGVMCEADHTTDARRISPLALRQFAALVDGDWSVLDAEPLEATAEQLVEDWGEYYLERPIRSLRLIDS
ncbi:DNA repair protein RecO [Bifidobacterium callitrichidarum]|uniref:DNA repair protein RecO n=1 Tax=Bifidobacterium callitrichidarum TaxID=2052941 RepID=A0A2U2N4Y8_9BIFI|nr:DNA repair protein RecO [Bifidobacterium callitrichidarum]PWG64226.1 DNA repair protein RecO [Bifidobacterium callitrichidarum]